MLALTVQPRVVDGQIVWEDSPLVRAVREGRVLVIDEADKAPLEVVSVLKSLLADGLMLLADGRRIVARHAAAVAGPNDVVVHANFRIFALANRPGYPFHGQDFFREMGDVFSWCAVVMFRFLLMIRSHEVDNPDVESEITLLRVHGPSLPEPLLRQLALVFAELRQMFAAGSLAYPYSTREVRCRGRCVSESRQVVNIVRHLERFPADGIIETVENVLAFDSYDPLLREHLARVLNRHGFPLGYSQATEPELLLSQPLPSVSPVATFRAKGSVESVRQATIQGESAPQPSVVSLSLDHVEVRLCGLTLRSVL